MTTYTCDSVLEDRKKIRCKYNNFHFLDLSNSEPVMFYATTRDETHSFTLEKKSILVFERVGMNIGGHYNNVDGIFVAPRKGIVKFINRAL
jgi:hypothetical protein